MRLLQKRQGLRGHFLLLSSRDPSFLLWGRSCVCLICEAIHSVLFKLRVIAKAAAVFRDRGSDSSSRACGGTLRYRGGREERRECGR